MISLCIELAVLIFTVFGVWHHFFMSLEQEDWSVRVSCLLIAICLTIATIYFIDVGGKMYA